MKKYISIALSISLIFVLLTLVPGRPAQALAPTPPYQLALPLVMRELGVSVSYIGPDVSRTMGVIQDPFNANILYAYTYGSGVYKSTNYGQTWYSSSKGMNYLVLHSMAADPVNPGVLYAGTFAESGGAYFGVYKSTNYGVTWAPTGEMGNTWNGVYYKNPVVYAIEIDPSNPQRIYAGTRMRNLPNSALGGGGVFRSENGGATWIPMNEGLPNDKLYAYDLEINPASPSTIYVTLHGYPNPGGIYISTNKANSWSQMMGFSDALDGRALKVDPFNSSLLYYGAGTWQGFRRYINGNWEHTNAFWNVGIGAISADPYHQGRVFAGICVRLDDVRCIKSLARSNDSGQTWDIYDAGDITNEIAFAPDRQTAFLSYNNDDGVYKSTDGGYNWFRSSSGLAGYSVTALAIDPYNPGVIVAALYGSGVKLTTDGGATWRDISPVVGDTRVMDVIGLAMHRDNSNLIFAITSASGVFYTNNRGDGWTSLNDGYPGPLAQQEAGAAQAADARAFTPYENRPIPDPEADLRAAEGLAAEEIIQPAALAYPNVVASSPFTAEMLIGTTGRGLLKLESDPEIRWASTGLASGTVYALAFDVSTSGRILAAMDSAGGSLLVSPDNGQTWTNSSTGLAGRQVYSLVQSHKTPTLFLAGTDNGVYASIDGGSSWAQVGLSGQVVKSVATHAGLSGVYYLAGSNTNLYYTDLVPGGSWKVLDPAFEGVGVQSMLRDPNIEAVFVTSRFSGILRVSNK